MFNRNKVVFFVVVSLFMFIGTTFIPLVASAQWWTSTSSTSSSTSTSTSSGWWSSTSSTSTSTSSSSTSSTSSSTSSGMALTKKYITVSRGTFAYRDSGNTSGTPVIMLHGWPESSYCWEGVAGYMNSNLRVIAPDLRGLGDSTRTTDVSAYQKLELAKDILAIADALGVSTFFLVGHDWGGGVAQEIAFLAPERVTKLVIINFPILTNTKGAAAVKEYMTSVGYKPYWYQYFQQQADLPEAMIKGNEELWVKHFFGTKATDGTIPSTVIDEYVRCYKISNTPLTAANYYRSMTSDYMHWATLSGKFAMPGLYIWGNQDTVIIRANTENLTDCFDSITVKELETAHFVMDEKPQEVATLLNNFLY